MTDDGDGSNMAVVIAIIIIITIMIQMNIMHCLYHLLHFPKLLPKLIQVLVPLSASAFPQFPVLSPIQFIQQTLLLPI